MMDDEERTDEDRIIEAIVLEGKESLYEDIDFLPLRQSLYNTENVIPEYDDDHAQRIEWQRPNMLSSNPQYFNPSNKQLAVKQGTLPDYTFLGTLMAICAFSKYDLIENIFASRPEDFLKYGIYTCRFYVDGEWVEVITDTNIPAIRNNITGDYYPAYGTSDDTTEMWVAFVEKAFAKAMGSYEEIPNIKVQKALLHLTGGSVQQVNLKEEVNKLDAISDVSAWNDFKRKLEDDSIVMMLPVEKKAPEASVNPMVPPEEMGGTGTDSAAVTATLGQDAASMAPTVSVTQDNYFVPDMLYSVVLCRELDGYELVLMHNPWVNNSNYNWTGEWSDSSNDWDLYPELLVELERDPAVPWRRRDPKGYFWISFRHLIKHFHQTYFCKLFPHDKFNFYCVRGECRGRQAGGPLNPVRHSDLVLKDAAAARTRAIAKATAAVVVDGDASWFNNPQFRLTFAGPGTCMVYLSVVPLGTGEEGALEQAQNVHITVTSQARHASQPESLWDLSSFQLVEQDRRDGVNARQRGQETSIWGLELSPKNYYHVVANTSKRGVEGDFILRVFSTKPLTMESVVPVTQYKLSGEWRRIGDIDSTGGPLTLTHSDGSLKENPKWCQNPQFHVELADPYGKDEVYLKVVVRRTDHRNQGGRSSGPPKTGAHAAAEQKKLDATVGVVITKAELLEDPSVKAKKKNQPKQNVMGEPIPMKASTLKKVRDVDVEEAMRKLESETPKTILRRLTVDTGVGSGSATSSSCRGGSSSSSSGAGPNSYYLSSTFSSKTESCVFYPKLPRAWIPNGLLVVPCLSEKGVKGSFDLEVYASERVYLNQLPETYSRTIAGDWTDSSAGGSHLSPQTWKKNPKFTLKFHYPVNSDEPPRVRLTLARHGTGWRNMCKRDTVGCMVGFYVFVNHSGDLQPFYESTFVPDDTVSSEDSFVMPQLQHGEAYTIMPATFSEGKVGSFVLSILSEYEFTITKDKN